MPSYNTSRNYHNPQITNYPRSHRERWEKVTEFKMVHETYLMMLRSQPKFLNDTFRIPADARNLEIVHTRFTEELPEQLMTTDREDIMVMFGVRYEMPVRETTDGITYSPKNFAIESFPRNQHMSKEGHDHLTQHVMNEWQVALPRGVRVMWESNTNHLLSEELDKVFMIDCHKTLAYVKSMDAQQTEIFLGLIDTWHGTVIECVLAAKNV